MRVMVMCGSLRPVSSARIAAQAAEVALTKMGVEVDMLDLSKTPLPFMDGREDESTYPAEVSRLRERVAQAEAFLVVSPEYHGGPSGALKNVIDLLDIPHFQGKAVALVATAGGPKGGIMTLSALRNTFRALMALVLPEQMAVTKPELDRADVIQRLGSLCESLVKYGTAMGQARGQ